MPDDTVRERGEEKDGWLARRLGWAVAEAPPERYRHQIRTDLLDETLKLANISAVTHFAVAVVIPVLFWDSASRVYLAGLFAVVTTIIGLTLYTNRLYRRIYADGVSEVGVARGCRISAGLALALGLTWATMPIMLFAPASDDQRLIIVATAAGLISDAYVVGPLLSVSFLFAVPLILGSFVGLARSGEGIALSIGVLLVVYAMFVLASVARMSRLSRERIHDRVRVEDQGQTIGLLLNEFEANTSDWLWETDELGQFQHVSARMAQALGRTEDDLHATSLATLLGGGAQADGQEGDGVAEILACLAAREPFRERLAAFAGSEGVRWLRLSGKPFQDRRGGFAGFRGVGSDVTASRAAEERIAYLATRDALTGLSNRAIFHEIAQAACREAGTPGGETASLLYLDLDGFKLVNDSAGHGAGDALLRQVADRIRAVTAAEPSAHGFRLGGDEFAILHRGSVAAAEAVAQSCVTVLGEPYAIDGVRAEIGVSVGLAHAPRDATDPECLLRKADLALYTAKDAGKGRWHAFDASLERRAQRHRELDAAMRPALENGEMALHYQPLVNLADGRVIGFEALLRWTRPGEGPVSPAETVPIAESTGFVIEIGRWALRKACAEAAGWPEALRVAVNISSIHFRLPGFVGEVEAALRATGLAPNLLEIEITETIFLGSTPHVIENLNRLRGLGVRIALDDFGTGFSSLSYLTQFPVDKIKIDRAFVRDLIHRRECLTVIEAIMVIARDLAIDVTVEGVETVQQAELLRLKRCNSAQGFLYSPARPARDIPDLIESIPHRVRHTGVRASAA
ncbi:diguanylate cyclase (GGDEF)-like protein [Methylorubrum rhodinum]|uniref:Diguanylate cyclase (GGDEF)-like protein n=1 Tax=Methylorubrum rhodinum TaxID=29428 RepID=A0A840ZMX4_9HYPH|nr:EAL domain-containing protein [Methylorubrum rhodinum]MBB5758956.1 diguanylate cyclase (GGDEF)-like protein [Methylorubrum rhodinum]